MKIDNVLKQNSYIYKTMHVLLVLLFIFIGGIYIGVINNKIDFFGLSAGSVLSQSYQNYFCFLVVALIMGIFTIIKICNKKYDHEFIKQSIKYLCVVDIVLIGLMYTISIASAGFIQNHNLSYAILRSSEFLAIIFSGALGVIGAIYLHDNKLRLPYTDTNFWAILLIIFGLVSYLLISIIPYVNFQSPAADVGLFNQVLWNFSRFHEPTSTIRGMLNIWADHFHPTLVLLAPFYWISHSPIVMKTLESIVVVSGAIPIYLLCKSISGNKMLGYVGVIAYLCFPGLQYGISFGFYPELMGPAFFAWAFWFLYHNRLWQYGIFIFLWLGVKEDVSIFVAFLGLFLLIFGKKYFKDVKYIKIVAIITFILGCLWFVFATKIVIPHFSDRVMDWAKVGDAGKGYIYFNYDQFGASPLEAAKNMLIHPINTINVFFQPDVKTFTILKIIASFSPLFILTPIALLSLPMFAENFLANRSVLWEFHLHYQAQYAAVLAIASIYSVVYLTNKFTRYKDYMIWGATVLILGSVILSNFMINSPFLGLIKYNIFDWTPDKEITRILKMIPQNASVSAQNNLAPYLSTRDTIYLFPFVDKADYIVLNPSLSRYPLTNEIYDKAFCDMLSIKEDYKLTAYSVNTFLFVRSDLYPYKEYKVPKEIIDKYCLIK